MGMSTHVIGFRPPDDKWRQMKAVWDSCTAAKVSPPREVLEFFDGVEPDPKGVEVPIDGAISRWSDGDRAADGFEVDLSKLPKDVKILRFYNSW